MTTPSFHEIGLNGYFEVRLLALVLLMLIGGALLAQDHGAPSIAQNDRAITPAAAPSATESSLFVRPLSEGAALRINAAMPFALADSPPAEPFHPSTDKEFRENALNCLAATIYYEASGQGAEGEAAVAQVVLNRVRHPAYPSSVCGVVFQGSNLHTGCQFTFTCDGSLNRVADPRGWAQARRAAEKALLGEVYRPVGLSTNYHANYVVPYWARRLAKNFQIGDHIFYRLPGVWGAPAAFRQHLSPIEMDYFQLRAATLMGKGTWFSPAHSDSAVQIRFRIDARSELARVVALLGQAPTAQEGAYEREARSYFADAAEDPAVIMLSKEQQGGEMLRGLTTQIASRARTKQTKIIPTATGDAGLSPELVDALAEFARERDFDGFFRGHRKFYRKVIAEAEQLAAQDAADWNAYTGIDLPRDPILISVTNPDANCGGDRKAAALDLLPITRTNVRSLIGMALIQPALSRPSSNKHRRISASGVTPSEFCTWQQIVHGVFARIADLSGPASKRQAAKRSSGDHISKSIIEGLKIYEAHRDRYLNLAEFLPELLRSAKTRAPVKTPIEVATLPPRACELAVRTLRFDANNPDSCVEAP